MAFMIFLGSLGQDWPSQAPPLIPQFSQGLHCFTMVTWGTHKKITISLRSFPRVAPLQPLLLEGEDPNIQAVVRLAVEAVGGFTVGICSFGKEALEQAIKAISFAPNVILGDRMMPGMARKIPFEALGELPPLKDTPVISITAKVPTHEVESYQQLGAMGVIRKPFDSMTLASTIPCLWATHSHA